MFPDKTTEQNSNVKPIDGAELQFGCWLKTQAVSLAVAIDWIWCAENEDQPNTFKHTYLHHHVYLFSIDWNTGVKRSEAYVLLNHSRWQYEQSS